MQQPVRIAPSILASDFARLGEEVRAVDGAGADYIHVDVMDGHFVPNITIGPEVVKALRPHSKLPFDVHLMIRPGRPLHPALRRGRRRHRHPAPGKPARHLHRSLQLIRSLGKKAGVALNPGTPVEAVLPVLELLDLVLVMSVNPGFGRSEVHSGRARQAGRPARPYRPARAPGRPGGRRRHQQRDGAEGDRRWGGRAGRRHGDLRGRPRPLRRQHSGSAWRRPMTHGVSENRDEAPHHDEPAPPPAHGPTYGRFVYRCKQPLFALPVLRHDPGRRRRHRAGLHADRSLARRCPGRRRDRQRPLRLRRPLPAQPRAPVGALRGQRRLASRAQWLYLAARPARGRRRRRPAPGARACGEMDRGQCQPLGLADLGPGGDRPAPDSLAWPLRVLCRQRPGRLSPPPAL